jgi:hypothetical protein
MTRLLSPRAGSGAAGLFLVYLACLVAVTNLIFTADVTATTRVPGGVARTGTYGINSSATPAAVPAPAPAAVAPVIAVPPIASALAPATVAPVIAAPPIASAPARPAAAPVAAAPARAHQEHMQRSPNQQADAGTNTKRGIRPSAPGSRNSEGGKTETS